MSDLPERPFRSLFVGGSLLALMAAALYFAGMGYHKGYLQAFYVDEALAPLPFDRSVAIGFQSLVSAASRHKLTFSLLTIVPLVLYYFWYSIASGDWVLRLRKKLPWRLAPSGKVEPKEKITITLRLAPSFLEVFRFLMLFILGIAIAVIGYRTGKSSGAEARRYCETGSGVFSGLVTLVPSVVVLHEDAATDKHQHLGYIVDRSEDSLVFYTDGTVRVLPISSVAEVRFYLLPDVPSP